MILVLSITGFFFLHCIFEKCIGISFSDLSLEDNHSFKNDFTHKSVFCQILKMVVLFCSNNGDELLDERSRGFSNQSVTYI